MKLKNKTKTKIKKQILTFKKNRNQFNKMQIQILKLTSRVLFTNIKENEIKSIK
jgi:hypothetical protein